MTAPTVFSKTQSQILGYDMSWVEGGEGPATVLLHGNLTSSFLWRDVLEWLGEAGRVIAPDLMGMGSSEKLEPSDTHRYTFARHSGFLDGLLSHLDVGSGVVLVGLGWGGALAFDWANRHRAQVAGLCYMETFVRPLTWDDIPSRFRDLLERLRTDEGDGMVLRRNILLKDVLPDLTLAPMKRMEKMSYTSRYRQQGDDRLPLLAWPRQLPIDGSPRNVFERVGSYAGWLATSDVPKLMIKGTPGLLLGGVLERDSRELANQTVVTVEGVHLLPEDSPEEIGQAIARWIAGINR